MDTYLEQDFSGEVRVIDASCCKKGGGAQVAADLIIHMLRTSEHWHYRFLLTPEVLKHIQSNYGEGLESLTYIICENPTTISSFLKYRTQIRGFIPNHCNVKIFTIFGPNFYFVKNVKFIGLADPFLTDWNEALFKALSMVDLFKLFVHSRLKSFFLFLNRDSRIYWCETPLYKSKLIRKYNINEQKIFVAANRATRFFGSSDFRPNIFTSELKILIVGANYPHKNFKLLSDLVPFLKDSFKLKGITLKWYITLNRDENLGLIDRCSNDIVWLGRLSHEELSREMANSIVLQPSLMEVFSATYIEAISMNRPLIISDLDFGREICQNAALYFDTNNPLASIESCLTRLVMNYEVEIELSKNRARIADVASSERDRNVVITEIIKSC